MLIKLKFVIGIKKYATLQEAVDRLNSFNTWGQITPDEYNELMAFAEATYNPVIEEVIEEDAQEVSQGA